jgi:hypothetical protein
LTSDSTNSILDVKVTPIIEEVKVMPLAENKRAIKGYIDVNLYEELKEVSDMLGVSMSKCITDCLVQGLEVLFAEAIGRDPKIRSKAIENYFKSRGWSEEMMKENMRKAMFE